MKIDINKVAEVLKKNLIEPVKLRRIIEELNLAQAVAQPDAPDEGAPKRGKSQHVIIVSDPKGVIKEPMVGWVVQVEEEAPPANVIPRIQKAAYDFNASKKGRLYPVKTIGDAIENVPRKYFKLEAGKTLVKTKVPVLVVTTDNVLPVV